MDRVQSTWEPPVPRRPFRVRRRAGTGAGPPLQIWAMRPRWVVGADPRACPILPVPAQPGLRGFSACSAVKRGFRRPSRAGTARLQLNSSFAKPPHVGGASRPRLLTADERGWTEKINPPGPPQWHRLSSLCPSRAFEPQINARAENSPQMNTDERWWMHRGGLAAFPAPISCETGRARGPRPYRVGPCGLGGL